MEQKDCILATYYDNKIYKFKEKSLLINKYLQYYNIQDVFNYFNNDFNKRSNKEIMKDLVGAANTIANKVIKNSDEILLVGDYDTDGITASSLFYLFILEKFNKKIDVYIPERIEGYGLSKNIVQYAINNNKKMIITVDNGIAAFEAIEYANINNIEVIITDHHSVQNDIIPNALYCVNPAQKDCHFEDKKLSGVGVIWNVLSYIDFDIAYKYLPLVAIGTIADVVPLQKENRLYVKEGLKLLNQNNNIFALEYIKEYFKFSKVESLDIGFKLAPHINSAGRMGLAQKAFQLFVETNEIKIKQNWEEIVLLNDNRKLKQKAMEEIINKKLESFDFKNKKAIIIYPETKEEDKLFDPSIAGIVASKIVETYQLPTIIFGYKNIIENFSKLKEFTWNISKFQIDLKKYKNMQFKRDKLSGSARGVFWFNFIELVEILKSKNLLVSGGGHKLAAGLTIKTENVDNIEYIFNNIAKNNYQEPKLIEVLEIFKLNDINKNANKSLLNNLLEDFEQLKPFGEQNPFPVLGFNLSNITDYKFKGSTEEHLSFRLGGIVANGWFMVKDKKLPNIDINMNMIAIPELSSFKNDDGNIINYHQFNIKKFFKLN